jgi:hypothetical protein
LIIKKITNEPNKINYKTEDEKGRYHWFFISNPIGKNLKMFDNYKDALKDRFKIIETKVEKIKQKTEILTKEMSNILDTLEHSCHESGENTSK